MGSLGHNVSLTGECKATQERCRRGAMFGERLEEWARARGVPVAYAKALQRFLDQG